MSEVDVELLRGWRGGDKDAGNQLVDRHFRHVYRYFLRRIVDRDTAKDLSQKTFVTALELVDRVKRATSFRAFLFGVARNVLRDHAKATARRYGRHERFARQPVSSEASPSQLVAAREEHRLLLSAMGELSSDLRQTIMLHYWEGLRVHEIADVLEVAAGTVKWRLSRARSELRRIIELRAESPKLASSTYSNVNRWAEELSVLLSED